MIRLGTTACLVAAVCVALLAGCQPSHVPQSVQAGYTSIEPDDDRGTGVAEPIGSGETLAADSATDIGGAANEAALPAEPTSAQAANDVQAAAKSGDTAGADSQVAQDGSPSPPEVTAIADVSAAAKEPAAADTADPTAAPAESQTLEITFDTIKFDMEKDDSYDRSLIGPKIEALSGKNIKIRGYILPASVFKQTGITGFVLVRDNMECCFGPGAALFDCIVVQMKPGKTTDFTVRPVAVEGTFKIEELENPVEPDGNPIAIYHLDGEGVE
jgi:hypothetical protein